MKKFSTLTALVLGLACWLPAQAQEDPSAGDTTGSTGQADAGKADAGKADDGATANAGGDELPMPPDGWWENVKGGEMARYQVVQMGQTMEMEISVDSRSGSQITLGFAMKMGGQQGPRQQRTLDVSDKNALRKDMPEGSKVTKLGKETIEAAGRKWDCTVYEIEGVNQGVPVKMKMWHSTDLLPVFNNGSVKMEMELKQGEMTINASMVLQEIGTVSAEDAGKPAKAKPAMGDDDDDEGAEDEQGEGSEESGESEDH